VPVAGPSSTITLARGRSACTINIEQQDGNWAVTAAGAIAAKAPSSDEARCHAGLLAAGLMRQGWSLHTSWFDRPAIARRVRVVVAAPPNPGKTRSAVEISSHGGERAYLDDEDGRTTRRIALGMDLHGCRMLQAAKVLKGGITQ
jgi:hypothetical protein